MRLLTKISISRALACLSLPLAIACGSDGGNAPDSPSGAAGGAASGGSGAGALGGQGGSIAGAGGADGESAIGSGPTPPPELIPSPTGTCPGFVDGEGCTTDDVSLICDFAPAGAPPRQARIWVDAESFDRPSPLVYFFHGLTRTASDAALAGAGLGPDVVQSIVDAGGLLVSMEKSGDLGANDFPWRAGVVPGDDEDFVVMDEILGCAIEKVNIDVSHIHATGMSAGGLQTGTTIARRSGYIASAVTFSGGQPADHVDQDPTNTLPVMIVHGGTSDEVILRFDQESVAMQDKLETEGHFTFICDHGNGHVVDLEAAPAAWQFFLDHPYGAASPYAAGLPSTMPSYCSL